VLADLQRENVAGERVFDRTIHLFQALVSLWHPCLRNLRVPQQWDQAARGSPSPLPGFYTSPASLIAVKPDSGGGETLSALTWRSSWRIFTDCRPEQLPVSDAGQPGDPLSTAFAAGSGSPPSGQCVPGSGSPATRHHWTGSLRPPATQSTAAAAHREMTTG